MNEETGETEFPFVAIDGPICQHLHAVVKNTREKNISFVVSLNSQTFRHSDAGGKRVNSGARGFFTRTKKEDP